MRYCQVCGNPPSGRLKVCSKCNGDRQKLLDIMEEGKFDPYRNDSLKRFLSFVDNNKLTGGYVPEFLSASPVETECEQCGNVYGRLGTGRTCLTCRKLARSWATHVSSKHSVLHSPRMLHTAAVYFVRDLTGFKVPSTFYRWVETASEAEIKAMNAKGADIMRVREESEARVAQRLRELESKKEEETVSEPVYREGSYDEDRSHRRPTIRLKMK